MLYLVSFLEISIKFVQQQKNTSSALLLSTLTPQQPSVWAPKKRWTVVEYSSTAKIQHHLAAMEKTALSVYSQSERGSGVASPGQNMACGPGWDNEVFWVTERLYPLSKNIHSPVWSQEVNVVDLEWHLTGHLMRKKAAHDNQRFWENVMGKMIF